MDQLNEILLSSNLENKISTLKIVVTLMVNFVTMNEQNQEEIWELCFTGFIQKLLALDQDRELLHFTCMLVYNCSCNSYNRRKALCTEGLDIFQHMLDKMSINGTAAEDHAFDWIYLIFKSSIEFLPSYYPLLKHISAEQIQILHLLEITLEDHENSSLISEPLALFLLSEFNNILSEFNRGEKARDSVLSAIPILVEIMGSITSYKLNDLNHILTTKGLLNIIILFCKQLEKFAQHQNDTWFNIQTKLIRIITNLTYEDSIAQDIVREEGGIPVILNSCIIKDTNPYMREWCILALRNLCIDNEQNQEYISNIKAQGIPEQAQEEMIKLGVRMELGIDGKVKFTRANK